MIPASVTEYILRRDSNRDNSRSQTGRCGGELCTGSWLPDFRCHNEEDIPTHQQATAPLAFSRTHLRRQYDVELAATSCISHLVYSDYQNATAIERTAIALAIYQATGRTRLGRVSHLADRHQYSFCLQHFEHHDIARRSNHLQRFGQRRCRAVYAHELGRLLTARPLWESPARRSRSHFSPRRPANR